MRSVVLAIGFGFFLGLGCASNDKAKSAGGSHSTAAAESAPDKVVMTPAKDAVGKVAKVNPNGQFVVLAFPPGQVPTVDRLFTVYRNGLKVAEVKVSGPQMDDNIVADVISGEAAVNDQVRER